MGRPLLWLFLVPWALPSAEGRAVPDAKVVLVSAASSEGWLAHRTQALLIDRLGSLGFRTRVVERPTSGSYRLSVTPSETKDPAASLAMTWAQKIGAKEETGAVKGDAARLEMLVAELVGVIAARAGVELSAEERSWLARPQASFAVQSLIGAGEAHLIAGDVRRAYSRFEQAAGEGDDFSPEAQALALRSKVMLSRGQDDRVLSDRDLATSALERARVARSRGRQSEALDAYRAYLRYEHRAALPEPAAGDIDPKRYGLYRGERRTHVETGGDSAIVFDEEVGTTMRAASRAPMLSLYEDDVLRLEAGPSLVRTGGARGAPRFWLKLPKAVSVDPARGLPIVRGYGALVGGPELAWVDLGLGTLSETFSGRVLASGEEGLLVVRSAGPGAKLCFFRPGRHQPSFELDLTVAPASAGLTRGRILLESEGAIFVHDSETGKRRAGPFETGSPVRFLGSHGRYGAVGLTDGGVLLLDVLAGEVIANVRGPSKAVAAVGHDHGVALFFETGDVSFYDREGRLSDRALVPGQPLDALPVGTLRPSLMVVSTEGVYFLLPPNPETPRDVDVFLEIALIQDDLGRKDAALRVATYAARLGTGRIGALESLRASLLEGKAASAEKQARAAALARAQAANDPQASLPRFAWVRER